LSERKLEILGLVPARGGSKGIPGKNLAVLGGKTLVARAVESGLESRFVNRVILSTDSPAIAEEGHRAGAEVPFMRPAELATDGAPTAPAVLHDGRNAQPVAAWAGPWPVDERWWDAARARRIARFQVHTADGRLVLLAVERRRWWLLAEYA